MKANQDGALKLRWLYLPTAPMLIPLGSRSFSSTTFWKANGQPSATAAVRSSRERNCLIEYAPLHGNHECLCPIVRMKLEKDAF